MPLCLSYQCQRRSVLPRRRYSKHYTEIMVLRWYCSMSDISSHKIETHLNAWIRRHISSFKTEKIEQIKSLWISEDKPEKHLHKVEKGHCCGCTSPKVSSDITEILSGRLADFIKTICLGQMNLAFDTSLNAFMLLYRFAPSAHRLQHAYTVR